MNKTIDYLGQQFKVRYYFDPDVREPEVNLKTGEEHEMMLGDIEGVEIYTPENNLIGSFDYIGFDNDDAIKKLIATYY